jgi:hypothetical protein
MGDIVFLALTLVFFGVSLGYVVYCDSLLPRGAA